MTTHGVESEPVGTFPPSGLDVLVVGTGLAGLTAAIECIRKGHTVRVLERAASINTLGDMYFMGLPATRFFKHWPEMKAEYDSIGLHNAWIETFKHSGGDAIVKPLYVNERLKAAGLDPKTPPGTFQLRPLIYRMFVRQVEKLGVQIEFNTRVIDYYEDEAAGKAGCVSDDGRKFEADVIIAADGVGSKSQKLVGGQVRARSSGRAMWRAAFPIENLDKNPAVKEHYKMIGPNNSEPIVRTYLGPGTYAMTLTRPETMIWIINHNATGSSAENWSNTIEPQEVLDTMDDGVGPQPWAPIFKELIKCTPSNTIVNFELLWRDPQPSWTSPGARVIQIGDAAHSFLPASGNGATQAIEDAVSIASCLHLGGKENVPDAVRAHIRFRFIRNACAQKIGFSNAELLQDTDWDKVKIDPRRAQPKHPRWVWQHDPETYTYENYAKNVETMKAGIRFDESGIPPNYPPGYKFEPWTIDWIMDCMKKNVPVDLGPGNWD